MGAVGSSGDDGEGWRGGGMGYGVMGGCCDPATSCAPSRRRALPAADWVSVGRGEGTVSLMKLSCINSETVKWPHERPFALGPPRPEVMEPGESFDQTGFELPPPPQVAPADIGPGELFGDDYSQSDSADGELVFWTTPGGQDFPDDDCVQPDARECAD
jgi:hypothetical protein